MAVLSTTTPGQSMSMKMTIATERYGVILTPPVTSAARAPLTAVHIINTGVGAGMAWTLPQDAG